jgi:hypothetical protein
MNEDVRIRGLRLLRFVLLTLIAAVLALTIMLPFAIGRISDVAERNCRSISTLVGAIERSIENTSPEFRKRAMRELAAADCPPR